MSNGNDTRPALTEDDRFDLQYAASATERRNQPRALVFIAGVVLTASLLAVVLGKGALGKVEASIRRESNREAEIARLITLLESTDETAQTLVYKPDPRAKLKIKEATQNAGIANVSSEPTSSTRSLPDGVEHVDYAYRGLSSHSIKSLLGAVQASLNAVEGLEVMEIKLTPGNKAWTMDIKYTRMVEAN
jgi:hypothetical protein